METDNKPQAGQASNDTEAKTTWLDRLKAEAADLEKRLNSLVEFKAGPYFADVPEIQKSLLQSQEIYMGLLLSVLKQRIEVA